jgi:F-type H+-transporting ATPase subunit alpha
MSLADQVMVIFAGVNGYLDDLPTESVRRFETEFLVHMHEKCPSVPSVIKEELDIPDKTEAELRSEIEKFKATFGAGDS